MRRPLHPVYTPIAILVAITMIVVGYKKDKEALAKARIQTIKITRQ